MNLRYIGTLLIVIVFFGIIWKYRELIGSDPGTDWTVGVMGGLVISCLVVLFFDKPEKPIQISLQMSKGLYVWACLIALFGCAGSSTMPEVSTILMSFPSIINMLIGACFSIGTVGAIFIANHTKWSRK